MLQEWSPGVGMSLTTAGRRRQMLPFRAGTLSGSLKSMHRSYSLACRALTESRTKFSGFSDTCATHAEPILACCAAVSRLHMQSAVNMRLQ
jgi:hypothetical protein